MSLYETRRAIRPLIDERLAIDAMIAYYAYHHDDNKTQIITYPAVTTADRVQGFVTISRTGIDLFRPFMTMKLPINDLDTSAHLLKQALPPGAEAFMVVREKYVPLIRALCHVRSEELLMLFQLSPRNFTEEVNVLITREDQNGLPRFVIKQPINGKRTAVAAAGLNWQSPYFAEIAVRTRPDYRQRGFGRAVVNALSAHLLKHGRTPLYAVNPQNTPSVQLAQHVGFTDTGHRELMLEVQMRMDAP